ncbi:MAG: NfeD family protein [Verrucomicrobiota bacterium]
MKHFILLAGLLAVFAAVTPAAPAAELPSSGLVYLIPIRGMIEPALLYVIRRGVSEAQAADARAIVFVMDTPGGTVDAARDIINTIQKISVPTYTFVEKNAFSAGAIIALATKHIYMAPGSVIGDAMPIMITPFGSPQEMPDDLKEKAVSGVAALVRSAAEAGGHDKQLAEKMVRRELEFKIGDDVIGKKGELLTLTNIEAERKFGKEKKPLLSEGTVPDLQGMLKQIGPEHAEVKELKVTAAEYVARFIAAFAPLFLMAGLLGIYIEIKTPGFGLPGLLGILSLAIFFWGHHIAGLAGMEDMLVFLGGLTLLLIEIFLIPGFGVVGVTGILLMVWAALSAMIERYPGGPWYPSLDQLQWPLLKLSGSLVGSAVVIALIARFLPESALFRRLTLEKAASRQAGYAASEDTHFLLGLEGKALSQLRPAGTAMFGDRKLDVVTRGDYLQPGTAIRIVESHGNRIIVEKCGDKA